MKKQGLKLTGKVLTGLVLLSGVTAFPTKAIDVKPAAVDVNVKNVKASVYEKNGHYYVKLTTAKNVTNVVARVTTEDRKEYVVKKEAIRFSTIDSNIQLSIAFVINCLLLVLGASLFYGHGDSLGRFTDLYNALQDSSIVGAIASPLLSTLFAVALLASGQNSTITGTLSGQIVMEGFIHMRLPMWMRRMLTRVIAVMPVVICLIIFGDSEQAIESLLIYTQVFLSIALPISIIPLTIFTSDKKLMGEFVIKPWMKIVAWICTVVLIILNFWLIISTFI